MRSKPRKKKAERPSYRKNWKSCSTARTKVRLALPFLQPSCALRSLFETLPLGVFGFAWLFLALRLSAGRGRMTSAASCRLRMLCSHLGTMRAHLGIARNRLRLVRHLIRRMRCVSSASSSGSFAGVHFGLVSRSGSLVSGFDLVPVCSSVSCPCCLILLLLPDDYVRLRFPLCFHLFPLPLQFPVLFRLALVRRLRPGD